MRPTPFYYTLSQRERESSEGYMLTCLMRVRSEIAELATSSDEDVNVYLAHLLVAVIQPQYHEQYARYGAVREIDLLDLLEEPADKALKYRVYRVNADHRLLWLGVFDNLLRDREPEGVDLRRRHCTEGYGSAYYHYAAEYDRMIHRARTPIAEVLDKLSGSFQLYEAVLTRVRQDYFDLLRRVSEPSLIRFVGGLSETPPESGRIGD
ncbi:MAG: hypothetical protein JW937_05370 [Candidatus Omnitrophica bacterium]|nr:hypothetical protein [Candidatus Omnitrophota bacterium]